MTKTSGADRGRTQPRRPGQRIAGRAPEQAGRAPEQAGRAPGAAGRQQSLVTGWATAAQRLVAGWGPTAARVLLGLVLAWFGYHELVQPSLWTGYVPVVSATSSPAVLLVLAHGWLLLLLSVAIVAGVAHRTASAVAALLMLEIVISLTVTGGLSDLTMRDVGVLGLAICLAASTRQRLLLRR
jgi:uncharacterized membrane protein YphA (DoxX/SURF4 family)